MAPAARRGGRGKPAPPASPSAYKKSCQDFRQALMRTGVWATPEGCTLPAPLRVITRKGNTHASAVQDSAEACVIVSTSEWRPPSYARAIRGRRVTPAPRASPSAECPSTCCLIVLKCHAANVERADARRLRHSQPASEDWRHPPRPLHAARGLAVHMIQSNRTVPVGAAVNRHLPRHLH